VLAQFLDVVECEEGDRRSREVGRQGRHLGGNGSGDADWMS
jgi:hypothetical protein